MLLVFQYNILVLNFFCRWLEKVLNDVIFYGIIVFKILLKIVDERKRWRIEYEEFVVLLKEVLDMVNDRKFLFIIVFCYYVCVGVFVQLG